MLNLITCFFIFPPLISSGQVKKLDNGNLIITGKGCGSTTELKYLPHLPDNPEDHDCVIVLKTSGKLADDKGRDFLSDEAQWAGEGSGSEGSGSEGSGSEGSGSEGSGSEGSDAENSPICDRKLIGNGVCQEECNVLQFNFDGGDCLNK